jgi:prepilin-type N-terminal cleavage/methylation domain-containing protein
MKQENSHLLAFTMIELLIVISIIGILATISVVSFSSVRANARDSTRLSDVTMIAIALEKYYNLHRTYPNCNGRDDELNGEWHTCLEPSLKPFLDHLPRDPKSTGGLGYMYFSYIDYYGKRVTYLYFPLEKINPNLNNASFSFYNLQYGIYVYRRSFLMY